MLLMLSNGVKFLPFIFKNLLRNRRRTSLTVLSMIASFFLFAALLSLVFLAHTNPEKMMARYSITVTGKGSAIPFAHIKEIAGRYATPDPARGYDPETLDRIAREGLWLQTEPACINAMMGFIWSGAKIGDKELKVASIDPVSAREIWTDMRQINEDHYRNFLNDRRSALVGRLTMNEFRYKIGDRIEILMTFAGEPLSVPIRIPVTITGVSQEGRYGNTTYLHRSYVEEFLKKSQVNMLFLNVRGKEDMERVQKEIEQMFANANPAVETKTQAQFLMDMYAVQENLGKLIIVVTVIIVGTILLVAGNSMAMAMRTRTSDVAVLKTLGFTQRQVVSLLLTESVLIGLVGGIVGCGLAYFALQDVTFAMSPSGYFRIDPVAVWSGITLSVVLGLVSGLAPSLRAAQLKIVDALRKVG